LLLLPFLPWFLQRWGMKWVLAVGMLCWGIRYFFFAMYAQQPVPVLYPLVIIGIALHGICFDFFFAAGFISVDNNAPSDLRSTWQALFTFVTYGVGMWLGNMISGMLGDRLTTEVRDAAGNVVTQTDWGTFWLIPALGVLACFAVFVVFFRDSMRQRV